MNDSATHPARAGLPRAHAGTLTAPRAAPDRPAKPTGDAIVMLTAPTATRRTVRQRVGTVVRRVVGVTLVLAALWWLALPLVFPVTSDAVVNARTVQVRAPIDGAASELTLDVGDPVAAGQVMARLDNPHLDTSGLTGLTSKRAELLTRRERLEKERAEVVKTEAVCREEAARYRDAVVANLEATHEELLSKARSGKVEHEAAARRLGRLSGTAGGMSFTELDTAREAESVARIRMDTDQAALAKCRAELEAAKKGLFLQKDSPHFQQRAEELRLRVPTIDAAMREAADLLAGVGADIARETDRTGRLTRATAAAPAGGTVWARQASRGQGVKQNEVLYEIADARTVFVEAVVHQRYLGAVAPGTPVVVNVTGGPSLTGRVRSVRTGRPGENEPTFAFGAAAHDPKALRVIVDLDPGFGEPGNLLGRHVRVLIADPAAGPAECAVVWLFSNLRLR